MTTDLGSIEDDTLDILTLRIGSSKYSRQKAYKLKAKRGFTRTDPV